MQQHFFSLLHSLDLPVLDRRYFEHFGIRIAQINGMALDQVGELLQRYRSVEIFPNVAIDFNQSAIHLRASPFLAACGGIVGTEFCDQLQTMLAQLFAHHSCRAGMQVGWNKREYCFIASITRGKNKWSLAINRRRKSRKTKGRQAEVSHLLFVLILNGKA